MTKPVTFGTLCAQAYFTPGVMEIFDQLVYAPTGMRPYSVPLPSELFGKSWFQVMSHFVDGSEHKGQVAIAIVSLVCFEYC